MTADATDHAVTTTPPPPPPQQDDVWHIGRTVLACLAALPLAVFVVGLCHINAQWLRNAWYQDNAFIAGGVAWIAWTAGITLYRTGRSRYQTLRDVWLLTAASGVALLVLVTAVGGDVESRYNAPFAGFTLLFTFVSSFLSLIWTAVLGVAVLVARRDLEAPVETDATGDESPARSRRIVHIAVLLVVGGVAGVAGWHDAYADVAPWTVIALALAGPVAFGALGMIPRRMEADMHRGIVGGIAFVSAAAVPVALCAILANHASITESIRRGEEVVVQLVQYRTTHRRYPHTLADLEKHIGTSLPRPTTSAEFRFKSGWRRFLLGFGHDALGPGTVYDSGADTWRPGDANRL